MHQMRITRAQLGFLGLLAPPLTLCWLSLTAATSGRLAEVSQAMFLLAGAGAVFVAGLVVGRLWRARAEDSPLGGLGGPGGWGGGGGPEWPVPQPGPDAIEQELQRIIAEEQAKLE